MPCLRPLDQHGISATEDVADLVIHARDAAGDHEVEFAPDCVLADGRVGRQREVVVRGVIGEEPDGSVEVEPVDRLEEALDDLDVAQHQRSDYHGSQWPAGEAPADVCVLALKRETGT